MERKITQDQVNKIKTKWGIIGESEAIDKTVCRTLMVAPYDMTVLIIGESGTGKEVLPKIIHDNSIRRHKKLVAVNCGAIPEGTIDSELFGHVKGAFTDATSDHRGYFETADGGTIFLDEVGEMPLATQARLLRVLETGEFMRVGSSEPKTVNLRVVAATNKDLAKAVRNGQFREDLYYRLSTVQIDMPPLRERGHDIWLITRYFLNNFSRERKIDKVDFAQDAREAFERYSWPGNVRQLKNVAERIALFEAGKMVTEQTLRDEHYLPTINALTPAGPPQFDYNSDRAQLFGLIYSLKQEVEQLKHAMKQQPAALPHITTDVDDLTRLATVQPHYDEVSIAEAEPAHMGRGGLSGHVTDVSDVDDIDTHEVKTLDQTERETIKGALKRNSGRRKATARELDISERTLYRKIKQYNL